MSLRLPLVCAVALAGFAAMPLAGAEPPLLTPPYPWSLSELTKKK